MVRLGGLTNDFDSMLRRFGSTRPLVLFSGAAPIAHGLGKGAKGEIRKFISFLQDLSTQRDVLLPAFPRLSPGEVFDLENTPCANGIIAESFRESFQMNRTTSFYFPFTAAGPSTSHLISLRPRFAWGDGSLYEWIETQDALIATVGVHPTVCSFQHRAEYLEADQVSYRYSVYRKNNLIRNGHKISVQEGLMVRKPGVSVDFKPVLPYLRKEGLAIETSSGVTLSAIGARAKLATVRKVIRANPTVFATEVS